MAKVPISLIIDDPTPRVSVYFEHAKDKFTKDGRPLVQEVPNSLLDDFCDVVDKYGLKGKFTVVPMPGGRGYITDPDGIGEFSREEIVEWIDTAITRLGGNFSFCPEMLTHATALDVDTGELYDINEFEWSKKQTKETFVPYIALAMEVLNEAGFDICGTSSPWGFGNMVKDEYFPAISEALYSVNGKKRAWVFCEMASAERMTRPYLAYEKDDFKVVSIPGSIGDGFWQTKDTTEDSEEYIRSVADVYISEDGKTGSIIDVLERGGYPILLTHWQSMHSNGLNTGLKALEIVAERVNKHLSERVEWMSFEEIMNMIVEKF